MCALETFADVTHPFAEFCSIFKVEWQDRHTRPFILDIEGTPNWLEVSFVMRPADERMVLALKDGRPPHELPDAYDLELVAIEDERYENPIRFYMWTPRHDGPACSGWDRMATSMSLEDQRTYAWAFALFMQVAGCPLPSVPAYRLRREMAVA